MFKTYLRAFNKHNRPAKKHPDVLRYEELEQRLLFSADTVPGIVAAAADPHVVVQDVNDDLRSATETTSASAAQEIRKELVFVNDNVADYQQLIAGLKGNSANCDIEVVILDSSRDGIEQVSNALAARSDLSAVHFISHGADGEINLGNSCLNNTTLEQNADQIAAWGKALTDSGDILLYGCNVAADSNGQSFVDNIARLTGADVAASNDLTGQASLGGDWTLEYRSGSIEAGTAVSPSEQKDWVGTLATYTVTNTNDDGSIGTLRWAINQANSTPGVQDTINFNIGTGSQVISVNSNLPTLTDQATIDGWTQSGYGGTPLIILDANQQASIGLELSAAASGSTIRGLVLRDFASPGGNGSAIQIDAGSDNNTIAGNYIGSFGAGGTDLGSTEMNAGAGISVEGSNNTIGGTSAADRNVIGGNAFLGIGIGRSTANLTGNQVLGNYIGVAADGITAVGNGDEGIYSQQGSGLLIRGNVIGANSKAGIYLWGETNAVIQGNYIGVGADGSTAVGNNTSNNTGLGGILLDTMSGALIGGSGAGEGNLIANNTGAGILVNGGSSTGNSLLGNQIYNNTGLGIDLSNDGVTANDAGDADTGANNLQNYPVLTSVDLLSSSQFSVSGSLNSFANSYFRIEFFASSSGDGTGYGEGQRYLGFTNVATDGSGNATFGTTLNASVASGEVISATATQCDAGFTTFTDTSEFASNLTVANTAPSLDASKSPLLAAEDEDAGAPSGATGSLISSLVDFASPAGQTDNITDPDSGALLGIAVTAADTTNGTWWYSTDAGGSWNALGAVSNGNARLLAADANTRIYFQPNANYNGTIASAITFRAWDQTSGSNGDLADSSTSGGSTAFSSATDTADLTINAVNDAPSGADNTVTTNENTAYTFSASDFGFSDIDGNNLSRVWITTLPGQGQLKWNGSTFAAGNWITVQDIKIGLLIYEPAANANGTGYASFTFQVQDDGGTANGGVDLDPTANTMTIDVAAANDAPSVTPVSLGSIDEGGSRVITQADLLTGSSDVNGDGLSAQSLILTGGSGTLTDNGDGTWTFAPSANWNGAVLFNFQVSDGMTSVANTAGLTVNAVNDAPKASDTSSNSDTTNSSDNTTGSGADLEGPAADQAENPVAETSVAEPVVDYISLEPIDGYLTVENSAPKEGSLPPLGDSLDGKNTDIIFLAEKHDAKDKPERYADEHAFIYFDNDLYKKITNESYLQLNDSGSALNSVIHIQNNVDGTNVAKEDLAQQVERGNLDRLRKEIDENYRSEQHARAVKTNIVSGAIAIFTVGIVSYLLRTASLIASIVSTLPLWRGFDPIVILSGKGKEKRAENQPTDETGRTAETLFEPDKQ